MSFLQDSSVADLTRGGQLFLHFLRMIGQVVRKFGIAVLLSTALISTAAFLRFTDPYERYLAFRYWQAHLEVMLRNGAKVTALKREDGSAVATTQAALAGSPTLTAHAARIRRAMLFSLAYCATGTTALFIFSMFAVLRAGSRQREEQYIRGTKLVEQAELRRFLRHRRRASDIKLADLPLVRGSETSHILLTGSTGTGKSTLLHQLMKRIRQRGDRCICYSKAGDFIEWFYREGQDVILNPFDARCPGWDLWQECPETYHHDMLAAALIPEASGKTDPFWTNAPRILFSSLTQTLGQRGERSIPRFMELLSQVDLTVLYDYLRGSEAAAVIDPSSEKTAASVRSTAVAYARALRYTPISRNTFHIREWVHNEQHSGWIFLNARAEQISSVRPLLSAWVEVFTNSTLSLPPSRKRRIWLILDELATLHMLPSLPEALAEGRKDGLCGVISFQDIAQMRDRYGQDGAIALTGQCATWVQMRQNHRETAKWSAESFGQVEVLESNQGVSYGANDMRDGVSLTQSKKVRPLLLDSQILTLNDLEGYIRLPGDLPVAHFVQQWTEKKPIASAFIERSQPSLERVAESVRRPPPTPIELAPSAPKRVSAEGPPTMPGLFDEEPGSGSDRPAA